MNKDDIANYTAVEKLRDQRPVTIRAIRAGDKDLFREAFNGLEAGSVYLRFFGPRKELTERELIQATEVDFTRTVALVACIQESAGERIIGGGRYFTLDGTDLRELDPELKGASPEAMAQSIVKQAKPGGIILLHDGYGALHGSGRAVKEATVQTLPLIIERLKDQGYTFVTVPELLKVPAYNQVAP